MRTQRFLTLAGASLAALFLSATAISAKTFVYCSEGSPENFTPPSTRRARASMRRARSTASWCASIAARPRCTSDLADKWEVSEDGKVITFHLRKGVKWHSGVNGFTPTRDFNADDVLFSFNRQWKPDHPYAKISGGKYDYFSDMDMPKLLASIEKKDDYTVVFTLTQPDAPILSNLAMDFATIQSAEYADYLMKKGTPEQFDQIPVGTGPFQFVTYQKDAVIRFKAQSELFHRQAQDRRSRLCDHARPDLTPRQAEDRGMQLIFGPRPQDLDEIKKDPDLTLLSQPGLNIAYWAFNTKKPPFDKKEVRQAFNMAIDKAAIIKEVYNGAGQAAKNLIPPTIWSYNDKVKDYPYDPEKAKAMLKEAG